MRNFIFILLFFSFSIAFAQESKSPEAGNAYNNGNNLVKQKKYSEAIRLYQTAVKEDPNFPNAYYMMGICYRKLDDFDNAKTALKKAIELDPKFVMAYEALGNLYSTTGEQELAINSYNAVITSIDDKADKSYFGLGNVYYEKKDFPKAIEYLKKAVEIDPKYSTALNILGICQQEERQFSEAEVSFTNAIKYAKTTDHKGSYYFRLGNVYLKMKKYNQAEEAFSSAIKNSKSQSIVGGSNYGLGEVYKNLGQTNKAIEYYQKAAKTRSWKASAEYEIDLLEHPDKYTN